ncbi:hypothetical protein EJB05_16798 [Eragrostis curvula]|uniref:SRP54-type proteins GTP-binding domain-containing protein n=1 Tax=Eragrostis curvula TaxID=38414 RepID=A0A5J9VIU8_9POAL|nr:hypothetical protein EJB05_16798 [Eragrostis curvula]
MSNATVIDEKVLNDCLNEISRALLQANVQFKMVRDMQTNIKRIVNLEALAAGTNKRRIMQQAVFTELCNMLDPGKPSFTPKKGNPAWSCSLVCKLKQNATKANIPFYGSYMESDPVKIAVEGVERFKKENCDLIIVDTSGRHKQEAALFEEMRQVSEATKPDLVIFVMDSSIGQAAFDQAQAFKQSVSVGAVIVTKMDGHVKEATKSPVIFIGTGEHIDEFEVFDVKPFVSRLLVMCGLQACPGQLAFGVYKVLLAAWEIGLASWTRFMNSELMPKGHEKESQAKIKRYMTMMDSVTDAEYKRLAKIWSKMKGLKIPKKGEMSAVSRNMNVQHMS